MDKTSIKPSLLMTAGEVVEVRSKEEILATLDENACLEGLPFMPEMFRYCGQRLRVYKRAHKTCDTVFTYKSRRMKDTVHLETRCDGSAHGGCQAACLIFWKEAWLKRVDANGPKYSSNGHNRHKGRTTTEDTVRQNASPQQNGNGAHYVCQATQLPYATTELNWWELDQYIEDYRSGNVRLRKLLNGLVYKTCYRLKNKRGLARLIRLSYTYLPPLWGGPPWPLKKGSIAMDQPTPTASLNLQPGELVRVKPYEEILRTINQKNMNKGMTFDKEMVPYCGGVYRVLSRVNRIVNERTGEMQSLKNACIILDSVICESRYSECRLFCPRSIYPYWREIWLERVNESGAAVEQRAN